jgi:hypothetical protein
MANKRVFKLWMINLISFILFLLLSVTGLVNWLLLPKGYSAGGGFWVSLRHSLVEIHQWIAVFFMVIITVHIVVHWSYIRNNLKRYRIV